MSIPVNIPREQWFEHPNYPGNSLLLESHKNFRRISRKLVADLKTGGDLRAAESLLRRWIAAMRSHESYEEYKLYPILSRRWDVDFSAAEEGHQALHDRYESVLLAFSEARLSEDARPALVMAMEAHDKTLHEHLALEEEMVLPLLLSMSPEEFDQHFA